MLDKPKLNVRQLGLYSIARLCGIAQVYVAPCGRIVVLRHVPFRYHQPTTWRYWFIPWKGFLGHHSKCTTTRPTQSKGDLATTVHVVWIHFAYYRWLTDVTGVQGVSAISFFNKAFGQAGPPQTAIRMSQTCCPVVLMRLYHSPRVDAVFCKHLCFGRALLQITCRAFQLILCHPGRLG